MRNVCHAFHTDHIVHTRTSTHNVTNAIRTWSPRQSWERTSFLFCSVSFFYTHTHILKEPCLYYMYLNMYNLTLFVSNTQYTKSYDSTIRTHADSQSQTGKMIGLRIEIATCNWNRNETTKIPENCQENNPEKSYLPPNPHPCTPSTLTITKCLHTWLENPDTTWENNFRNSNCDSSFYLSLYFCLIIRLYEHGKNH